MTDRIEPQAEPILKLRNYRLHDDVIQHEQVKSADVAELVDRGVEGKRDEIRDNNEVVVVPKKANWDLRRDIADKLAFTERRTQAAMIKLMNEGSGHDASVSVAD
ncbi:Coiled-coil domain-containing protein 12 [Chlorella vulgaris]